MNPTEKLEQAEIEASIARERIPNHPIVVAQVVEITPEMKVVDL